MGVGLRSLEFPTVLLLCFVHRHHHLDSKPLTSRGGEGGDDKTWCGEREKAEGGFPRGLAEPWALGRPEAARMGSLEVPGTGIWAIPHWGRNCDRGATGVSGRAGVPVPNPAVTSSASDLFRLTSLDPAPGTEPGEP